MLNNQRVDDLSWKTLEFVAVAVAEGFGVKSKNRGPWILVVVSRRAQSNLDSRALGKKEKKLVFYPQKKGGAAL
jgi:hypothetical protein